MTHPAQHRLARLAREPISAWPRRAWDLVAPAPRGLGPAPSTLRPFPLPGPRDPLPAGVRDLRSLRDPDRHRATGAWHGAHEAAFQLVSAARAGDPAVVHALAARIAATPSRGTSAANHRVGELGALALAARILPEGALHATLRAQAATLPEVLAGQLAPDGLGVEGALGYHLQNLEWADLAARCGVSGLEGALDRGAGALRALLDLDGALPDLGDDDGGGLHAGAPGDRLRALPGNAATLDSAHRTLLANGAHRVLVDHGPHGLAPLFAHAHADALGVWWAPHGRWTLGGRGTGRYLGDPADRRFRRGTSAHATVVVDGADQSVAHDDPFLWRTVARAWREDLGPHEVRAAHDGYLARRGVLHRRTVRLDADGALHLRDHLDGNGVHHVAVTLPLRPGASVRLTADPRTSVRERADRHSPAYGVFVPATTLVCEAVVRLPITLATTVEAP